MPQFTVESVERTRDWGEGSQYGPKRSYYMRVTGHDAVVELAQKLNTPPPTVGQVIEGTLEPAQGDYPRKLKKAQQQNGFGGGGPRPEDPARSRRIVRQHSQSTAVDIIAVALGIGIKVEAESVGDLWNKVIRPLADTLDKDVQRKGEAQ